MRRTRKRPLPMPERMGPSDDYVNAIMDQLDILDNEPEWFVAMVHEYGVAKATAARRQGVTPERTRALLLREFTPISRIAR